MRFKKLPDTTLYWTLYNKVPSCITIAAISHEGFNLWTSIFKPITVRIKVIPSQDVSLGPPSVIETWKTTNKLTLI